MMHGRVAMVALLALGLAGPRAWAETPPTKQLLGVFVGEAADDPPIGPYHEQREIDMEIVPFQDTGLRVTWTNVTLVDGRRDVPGVRRHADEMLLVPAPGRSFFLAGVGYDPFQTRRDPDAMRGDPLRWAAVNGEALDAYSFVIDENGAYELQISQRHPIEEGMGLNFMRIVDGEVVRRMTGRAVRAAE